MVRLPRACLTEAEQREADDLSGEGIQKISDIDKLRRFEQYYREMGFGQTADACAKRLRGLSDATDSTDQHRAEQDRKSVLSDLLSFQARMNADEVHAAAVRARSPKVDPVEAVPSRKARTFGKTSAKDCKLDVDYIVEQNKGLSSLECKAVAEGHKEKGNDLYREHSYNDAVDFYTVAIKLHPATEYFANRAAALLNLKRYEECVADCTEAVKLLPRNFKAYLRRAKAYLALKKYEECLKDLDACAKVAPNSDEVAQLKRKAEVAMGRATLTPVTVDEDDVSSDDGGDCTTDQGLPATCRPAATKASLDSRAKAAAAAAALSSRAKPAAPAPAPAAAAARSNGTTPAVPVPAPAGSATNAIDDIECINMEPVKVLVVDDTDSDDEPDCAVEPAAATPSSPALAPVPPAATAPSPAMAAALSQPAKAGAISVAADSAPVLLSMSGQQTIAGGRVRGHPQPGPGFLAEQPSAASADEQPAASPDHGDVESFTSALSDAEEELSSFASCPSSSSDSSDDDSDLSEDEARVVRERAEAEAQLKELRSRKPEVLDVEAVFKDSVERAQAAKRAGNQCFDQGDPEGALRHYQAAVELLPGNAQLHSNCMLAHMKLKQDWEAVRSATVALSLDKTHWRAFQQRGFVKEALGYLQGAKEDLDIALKQMTDDQQRQHTQRKLQLIQRKLHDQHAKQQQELDRTKSERITRTRTVVIEEMDDGPEDFEAKRVKERVQQIEADAAAYATRIHRKAQEALDLHADVLRREAEQKLDAVRQARSVRLTQLQEEHDRIRERRQQRKQRAELRAAKRATRQAARRWVSPGRAAASPPPPAGAVADVRADVPAHQPAQQPAAAAVAAPSSAAPACPTAAHPTPQAAGPAGDAAAPPARTTRAAAAAAGEATSKLDKALALRHNETGKQYFQVQEYSGALHFFRVANELDPDEPRYHNNIAQALLQLGEHRDALEAATRAEELLGSQGTGSSARETESFRGKAIMRQVQALKGLQLFSDALITLQRAKPRMAASEFVALQQELHALQRAAAAVAPAPAQAPAPAKAAPAAPVPAKEPAAAQAPPVVPASPAGLPAASAAAAPAAAVPASVPAASTPTPQSSATQSIKAPAAAAAASAAAAAAVRAASIEPPAGAATPAPAGASSAAAARAPGAPNAAAAAAAAAAATSAPAVAAAAAKAEQPVPTQVESAAARAFGRPQVAAPVPRLDADKACRQELAAEEGAVSQLREEAATGAELPATAGSRHAAAADEGKPLTAAQGRGAAGRAASAATAAALGPAPAAAEGPMQAELLTEQGRQSCAADAAVPPAAPAAAAGLPGSGGCAAPPASSLGPLCAGRLSSPAVDGQEAPQPEPVAAPAAAAERSAGKASRSSSSSSNGSDVPASTSGRGSGSGRPSAGHTSSTTTATTTGSTADSTTSTSSTSTSTTSRTPTATTTSTVSAADRACSELAAAEPDPAVLALQKLFTDLLRLNITADARNEIRDILSEQHKMEGFLQLVLDKERAVDGELVRGFFDLVKEGAMPSDLVKVLELVQRGEKCLAKKECSDDKRYMEAAASFGVACRKCPKFGRVVVKLAQVYAKQGKFQTVVDVCIDLVDTGYYPDDVDSLMIDAYFELQQYERAVAHLEVVKVRNKYLQRDDSVTQMLGSAKLDAAARMCRVLQQAQVVDKAYLGFLNRCLHKSFTAGAASPAPRPRSKLSAAKHDADAAREAARAKHLKARSSSHAAPAASPSPTPPAPQPPTTQSPPAAAAPSSESTTAAAKPQSNGSTTTSSAAARPTAPAAVGDTVAAAVARGTPAAATAGSEPPPLESCHASPAAATTPAPSSSSSPTPSSAAATPSPHTTATSSSRSTPTPTSPPKTTTTTTTTSPPPSATPAAAQPQAPGHQQPSNPASAPPAESSLPAAQGTGPAEHDGSTGTRQIYINEINNGSSDSEEEAELMLLRRHVRIGGSRPAPTAAAAAVSSVGQLQANGSRPHANGSSSGATGLGGHSGSSSSSSNGQRAASDAPALADAAYARQQHRPQKLQVPRTAEEFARVCRELQRSGRSSDLPQYVSMIEPRQYRGLFKSQLTGPMVACLVSGLADRAQDDPALVFEALNTLATRVERFEMAALSLGRADKARVAAVLNVLEGAGLPVGDLHKAYRL